METLRGRAQSLVTRVRLAYYSLLLAQEDRRLIENSVGRVRQSLEETMALQRAGLSSEYDVLRLQVELANLEPNLRRTENAVSRSRRNLALELNLEGMETLAVSGSLASMDPESLEANQGPNREILEMVVGDPRIDTVYLLSSGEPEVGLYVHWNRVTEHLRKLNRFHKVKVHTVVWSDRKWYRDQLQKIAECTGGRFIAAD